MSGYSLVEEGEQVTHHHQRRPRDAQQDLTDALRSLVHVLDSCSKKCTREKPSSVSETSRGVTQRHILKEISAGFVSPLRREDEFQKDKRDTKTKKLRGKVSAWAEDRNVVFSAT